MNRQALDSFANQFEKEAFDPDTALAGGGLGAAAGAVGGGVLGDRMMKAYMARKYGLDKINPEYLRHLRRRSRGAGALGLALPIGLAGALAGGLIGREKTAGLGRKLLGLGALTGGGLLGLQALGTTGDNWRDYLIPNPQAIAAGGQRAGQLARQGAATAGDVASRFGSGLSLVPDAFLEGYRGE
jgi:hypothetical protein